MIGGFVCSSDIANNYVGDNREVIEALIVGNYYIVSNSL
jgi:hypothetical protein